MQEHNSTSNLVIWVPTPYEIVRHMLVLAEVSPADIVYDLGCGDGRVLILAAKDFNAKKAVGYELRQDLCKISRKVIQELGLQDRITIANRDFRDADFSEASVVTLYLTTDVNQMLFLDLISNLRPGSRVVSYLFPISGWLPVKEVDLEGIAFIEGKFIGKLYPYLVPQAFLNT